MPLISIKHVLLIKLLPLLLLVLLLGLMVILHAFVLAGNQAFVRAAAHMAAVVAPLQAKVKCGYKISEREITKTLLTRD
jgi:hypothetical protein